MLDSIVSKLFPRRASLSAADRLIRSRISRWVLTRNLADLEGRAWAQQAETMLADNPQLDQVSMYTQAALVDRPWRWLRREGRDTDAARRNEKFMNENFFGGLMDRPWDIIAQQMARFIDIGWRVGEVAYGELYDHARGRWIYYVKDIHDIRPTNLGGWKWSADSRQVESMMLVDGTDVPLRKCVHLRHRHQGDDPEGDLGRLYSCRRVHDLFQLYQDLIAVGGEKWALQTPVVERNPEADRHYDSDTIAQMVNGAFEAAENYAAGENSVLMANPAVRLSTFGASNGFNPNSLVDVCRWTGDLGAGAYMAGSLTLGQGKVGAKNLGELLEGGLMTMLSQAAKSLEAGIGDRRQGHRAVLRVLDLTFGDQDPRDYPVFRAEGLQEAYIARIMNVLPNWMTAGVPAAVPDAWRALLQYGGVRTSEPPPERTSRAKVALPNLDPSAGGLPAKPRAAA